PADGCQDQAVAFLADQHLGALHLELERDANGLEAMCGNFAPQHVHEQAHAPPPSRRSSSRESEAPISTNRSSIPRMARTASSLREPNSGSFPRSKRDNVSWEIPARAATSPCFRPSERRRVATASPSSTSACI